MFDPDKTYSIGVHSLTFYVVDCETDEVIKNADGSWKQFTVDNYEYSYLADGIEVEHLKVLDTHREYR